MPIKDSDEKKNPVKVAILSGLRDKLVKPSMAKESIFLKEYFVTPANLESLAYLTCICLKPTHEIKPLINLPFSGSCFNS